MTRCDEFYLARRKMKKVSPAFIRHLLKNVGVDLYMSQPGDMDDTVERQAVGYLTGSLSVFDVGIRPLYTALSYGNVYQAFYYANSRCPEARYDCFYGERKPGKRRTRKFANNLIKPWGLRVE
jgi:hypothetical protein